jgi:hypothetical protein
MTEESKLPVLYRGTADQANPLARYQSSRAVRIVADRIMALDSQGLQKHEGILVAQACLVHRLNPFPPRPEIHYWIDTWHDRQTGLEKRRLNIMEHREATIRKAEENAKREGTYLEAPRFFHLTENVTKESLGFDVNDKVCRCEVSDHRQVEEYYKQRLQFKDEGLDSKEIDKRIGKVPDHYVGYASLTTGEVTACKKSKFSAVNKIQKRAYIEALKQKWAPLVNIDEFVEGAPDDDDAYVIDAEWIDAEIGEDTDAFDDELEKGALFEGEETQKSQEAPQTSTEPPLQEPESPPVAVDRLDSQWEDNVLAALVDLGLVKAREHAVNILNLSVFKRVIPYGKLRVTQAIAYALCWEETKTKEPDLSSEERAKTVDQLYPGWEEQAIDLAASLE